MDEFNNLAEKTVYTKLNKYRFTLSAIMFFLSVMLVLVFCILYTLLTTGEFDVPIIFYIVGIVTCSLMLCLFVFLMKKNYNTVKTVADNVYNDNK